MTDDFLFPSPTSPRHYLHKAKFSAKTTRVAQFPLAILQIVCLQFASSRFSIHGLNQVYTATVLIVDLLTDAPVVPKTRQFALCSRKCYFFLHLHPNGSH